METNLIDSKQQPVEKDQDDSVLSPDEEQEADTYPLCDNEPTSESNSSAKPDTDQVEELRETLSQDSLIDDEQDEQKLILALSPSSSATIHMLKLNSPGHRTTDRDEHIRSVQHKKEETDVLRRRRIQEQLQKKEEKWQHQQLERVKKWLQLRNRDTDHRSQVEERRRKREDEAKAKVDEILRREKAREQRTTPQLIGSPRVHALHPPSSSISVMNASSDVPLNRRAPSSVRAPSTQLAMTHRRESTDSPVTVASQDTPNHSASANSSHQVNPTDGHRYHRASSSSPRDATMTNEDSSVSGTGRSSARSRTRPMPASYTYWLNTGESTTQNNAHFMRLTYAATCRSRLSRSVERCPRACRAHDEVASQPTPTNGEPQRRIQSVNRQQLNESISRLSKPKTVVGIPMSQSSYQLRASTPPVSSSNTSTPRKFFPARSTALSASTSHTTHSTHDFRASPTNDSTSETASAAKSSSQRPRTHSKPPLATTASKPPVSSSTRSKPPVQRSLMNTSQSSSSLSSASTIIPKANQRRAAGPPVPSKPKSSTSDTVSSVKDDETVVDENQSVTSETTNGEQPASPPPPVIEPVDAEVSDVAVAPNSKKEQQQADQQEYQRKLGQKIREAQQRLEQERQQEEERLRQLEFEELEREQEQIRLVEEQRQVEEERLQRAIEECQRENELKRQEELRLQQQREELEKRQAEEAERLQRERQEKAKKEEEERIERKKRLDLIMKRTRIDSPISKSDNPGSKTNANESNGHDQSQSMIVHSMSEQNFSSNSSSTENILDQSDANSNPNGSKFKSPLIQSLLNKARNTRSTDNLTGSGIQTDTPVDSSEEEHDHSDVPSTGNSQVELSSTRPMETATAFQ